MSTDDRTDLSAQPPPAAEVSPQPKPAAGTSPGATPRSILGRLAGRWKGILLVWLVAFPPVAYLLYGFDAPSFEAFSILLVEPRQPSLFMMDDGDFRQGRNVEPYVRTQVQLMTSDKVLDAALSRDPRVARLPMIRKSIDPRADLRRKMKVEIVEGDTYLIRVALISADPSEAAMIVNAVVDAYMDQHTAYHRSANKQLYKTLTYESEKLSKEIQNRQAMLRKLDGIDAVALHVMARPVATKKDEIGIPSLEVLSDEQYRRVLDRLSQADLELIDAQAKLETARLARKATEARLRDEPAIARAATGRADEKIRELESIVDEIKRKRIGYMQYLQRVKVETPFKNSDSLTASFANQELTSLLKMKDIVTQKLEQLNFEEKQEVYRITPHDRASVPKAAMIDRRLPDMAAASLGVLFLILGVFLTREIAASRIPARDLRPPQSAS